jgi:CBS domain containing-hemolysin-like protein
MRLLLALLFLVLALAGVIVRKTYYQLPERELKRRAARHDQTAEQVYRAVAYGNSTKTLLWTYIGLTSAACVILLGNTLPVWTNVLVVAITLWVVFSLIPATRLTAVGARLAILVTPVIAWFLNYLHPVLNRAGEVAEKRYVAARHTRLYEREDLLELIERQKQQADSRFTPEELEIAERALQFDEQSITDILTPRKELKTVKPDDLVGPVLIDEVHKSGQKYAFVKESTKGPIIGILEVGQLGIKSTGHVRDLMKAPAYYVHEDDTLAEALRAFFVTNHPVFVVVNNFEEVVGIISVENILQQLLGHVPGDDFEQYADLAAVAARHNKAETADLIVDEDGEVTENGSESDEEPVKTDDEVIE